MGFVLYSCAFAFITFFFTLFFRRFILNRRNNPVLWLATTHHHGYHFNGYKETVDLKLELQVDDHGDSSTSEISNVNEKVEQQQQQLQHLQIVDASVTTCSVSGSCTVDSKIVPEGEVAPEPEIEKESALCINGCGLFGFPETNNFCSKCYNRLLLDKYRQVTASVDEELVDRPCSPKKKHRKEPSSGRETFYKKLYRKLGWFRVYTAVGKPALRLKGPERSPEKDKDRCDKCNKKVKLHRQYRCSCGYMYCPKHRLLSDHLQNFDYKMLGKHVRHRRG